MFKYLVVVSVNRFRRKCGVGRVSNNKKIVRSRGGLDATRSVNSGLFNWIFGGMGAAPGVRQRGQRIIGCGPGCKGVLEVNQHAKLARLRDSGYQAILSWW